MVAREDSHTSQRRISVEADDDERVFGVSGGVLLVPFINKSDGRFDTMPVFDDASIFDGLNKIDVRFPDRLAIPLS